MNIVCTAVLVAACLVLAAATSRPAAAEFRGAWVSTWQRGCFTSEEIDLTISEMKKAGLNALILEARKAGDAYYQSKIEPMGPEVPEGFDPLAYAIEKAHPEGIQVHAWLVVYRVWKGANPPANAKHVLSAHPEWACVDYGGKIEAGEGIYIDPGIPEYREHFASVCEDIARRYKVDGIHFDYVRYPEDNWGYSDIALKRYYAETGATTKPAVNDPKWLQWKRDQVTALVKLVRDRVKAINPNVKIQASTIPWGNCPAEFEQSSAYMKVCQDWRMWMERGLIDENCPMVYAREGEESGAKYFRGWVEGAKKWSYGRPIYVGMSASWNTPDQMMKQVEVVRQSGLQGFTLFHFNQNKDRPAKAQGLGAHLYPAPKLPVNQITGEEVLAAGKAVGEQ